MEIILGLVAVVTSLFAYIFYKNAKEDSLNSELAQEKAKNKIGRVLFMKEEQKEKADAAQKEYDSFRDSIMHEFDNDDDDGGTPAA